MALMAVASCALVPESTDILPWATESELDGDYAEAVEADSIVVPPDLDSKAIQQAYPIPDEANLCSSVDSIFSANVDKDFVSSILEIFTMSVPIPKIIV
mgnify:CR=1 FL=1